MSTKFTVYVIIATILICIQNFLTFAYHSISDGYALDTLIFSLIAGIALGLFLTYKYNLPKSNMGMNCLLLLLLFSPYIMRSGYFIAYSTPTGEMQGINLSILLFTTILAQIATKITMKLLSYWNIIPTA